MLSSVFGFRLNTAGVIIGWIGAAVSLITIVLLSISFGYLDEIAKAVFDQMNDKSLTLETIRNVLLTLLCIYITINSINLAASALLVAGTIKERHLLLVPWLLNSGLSLLFNGAYMLYIIITVLATSAPFGAIAATLISGGLNFVINFYIWYAIYSLYKEIQANRDMQQRLLPPTSSSYPSYTKI